MPETPTGGYDAELEFVKALAREAAGVALGQGEGGHAAGEGEPQLS